MSILGDFFKQLAKEEEEQAMIAGFHGILETEKQRKKMSPTELAIRLSKCDKDSPAYVLLSHELNRRIAGIQATATYIGAVIGGIAAIIGGVAGFLLGTSIQNKPTTSSNTNYEHTTKTENPIEKPPKEAPRIIIPTVPKQPEIKQNR